MAAHWRALSHSVAFFTTYTSSSYSLVPYSSVLQCFRQLSCRLLHFFSLITQFFPPYASTWVQGVLCAIVSRHSTTSILTYNIFMLSSPLSSSISVLICFQSKYRSKYLSFSCLLMYIQHRISAAKTLKQMFRSHPKFFGLQGYFLLHTLFYSFYYCTFDIGSFQRKF